MPSRHLHIFVFVIGIMHLTSDFPSVKGQNKPRFVEITGLNRTYSSCAPVDFSLRNSSMQEIYTRVYVEMLGSGSWKDDDCPYDIADPKSWLAKRILVNPKMTKPGESVAVVYDRCSDFERCFAPMFGKNDVRASRLSVAQEDAKAAQPVTQRFRIEIHVRDPHNPKYAMLVAKEYSQSFTRVPDKKTD